MKKNNQIFIFLFLLLSTGVLFVGQVYKKEEITTQTNEYIRNKSQLIIEHTKVFIAEKQNATLAIAMSLAQDKALKDALKKQDGSLISFKSFSRKLNEQTEFKNVWVQVVTPDGISLSRSWTDQHGDKISAIRTDLKEILQNPQIKSTISVGMFDMTFKSIVPVYDEMNRFLGVVEIITHFNSIAEKIKAEGFEPLVLADKRYKEQLTQPFSGKFIGEYYVANLKADPKLLEFFQKKNIEEYFTYRADNYTIVNELNAFIVTFNILDHNNDLIGYILSVHPLDTEEMIKASHVQEVVNLYVTVLITLFGILFYLLAHKGYGSTLSIKGYLVRLALSLGVLFLATASLFFYLTKSYYAANLDNILKLHTERDSLNYQIIYNELETLSNAFFDSVINKEAVQQIMEKANSRYPMLKDQARQQLWELLKEDYTTMKSFGIKQLHFHLPDNESFLRFHRPAKYGDNLTGIRSTVEWVNQHQEKIHGFEEGRIYNGYRFVYPLFAKENGKGKGKHIGSVEISFTVLALLEKYIANYRYKLGFLIKKEVVDTKVFASEMGNYIYGPLPGFYFEKSLNQRLMEESRLIDPSRKSRWFKEKVAQELKKEKIFTFYSPDDGTVITFIPISNTVTKKTVGFVIIEKEDPFIHKQQWSFYITVTLGIVILFFTFIFIFRELANKFRFQQMSEKTKKILDEQYSIVILSDGQKMQESNQRFFDFTGYPDLEAFKQEHDCVCDLFQQDDEKEYLQKTMNGLRWDEYLLSTPTPINIAKMSDLQGQEHLFSVNITLLERVNNTRLITLHDVTESLNYQKKLEFEVNKAVEEIQKQQQVLLNAERKAAMGEMIGVIAHQLKQPLNSIALLAQDVLESYRYNELDEKYLKEYEAQIMGRVEFMSQSIDDFRNFFNPNKQPKPFSLRRSIEKAVAILQTQLSGKGITLHLELSDDSELMGFDSDIQQVILNLVSNARDALLQNSVTDPHITISLSKSNEKHIIKVEDNGGGIPEKVLPKIFDYYFSTKGEKGTGIGLHLAKMIIENNMQGSIKAYNSEIGAIFEIVLG